MIVTCAKVGCENAGIDIEIEPPLVDDELLPLCPEGTELGSIFPGWTGVICGGCGSQLHTHEG